MERRGHSFDDAKDIEEAHHGCARSSLSALPFAQGVDRDAEIIGHFSRGKIEAGSGLRKAQGEGRAGIFWGLGFGIVWHFAGSKKAREIVPGMFGECASTNRGGAR